LARTWVSDSATAEEVVQESWLSAIDALEAFEGRSKLGTWLAKIVVNKAKTRGARERRSVSVPSFDPDAVDDVERGQFDRLGFWKRPPVALGEAPDAIASNKQAMAALSRALDELPPAQRAVIILRDVEGADSEEACNVLGVSESNQRVLLHRGRARLRIALLPYFPETAPSDRKEKR
jgi:RNA polymerase sigma-70 factor, ECF subfamily